MLKKGGKLKSAHNVENTQNPEKRRKYDVRQSICLGGLIMGSNHKGDSNAGYVGSQYWQENREKKKNKKRNSTEWAGRNECQPVCTRHIYAYKYEVSSEYTSYAYMIPGISQDNINSNDSSMIIITTTVEPIETNTHRQSHARSGALSRSIV